jgi:hypothetical protein
MPSSLPTPDPTGKNPPKQAPVQPLGPRPGSAVPGNAKSKKLPTGGRSPYER